MRMSLHCGSAIWHCFAEWDRNTDQSGYQYETTTTHMHCQGVRSTVRFALHRSR